LHQVKIDNKQNWNKKHLATITQNYSKSPFFEDYIDIFYDTLSNPGNSLVDLNIKLITNICKAMEIDTTKLYRSSELGIKGNRIQKLINICHHFNADIFYEGAAGRNYINDIEFNNEGIQVNYQDYNHPKYNQRYGNFIEELSIIDLLFNCGKSSLSILSSNAKELNNR